MTVDYFQVIADGLLDFGAGVAAFDQAQQLADGVKIEPQYSDGEPLQVMARVKPATAFSARRQQQKANFLVIAPHYSPTLPTGMRDREGSFGECP
jgi:hypothetical protein